MSNHHQIELLLKTVRSLAILSVILAMTNIFTIICHFTGLPNLKIAEKWHLFITPAKKTAPLSKEALAMLAKNNLWQAPNIATAPNNEEGKLIRYGHDLVANTAKYIGPKGSVAALSNGMNCQNCHLDAGTKPWGNNYGAVAATYPKFRERSGGMEDIYKRVNDCVQRSLNGKALDTLSREMQGIKAYIEWLGKDVPKKTTPNGAGIYKLAYLSRPTNTVAGQQIYTEKCQSCHQANGQGALNPDGIAYQYPPLWGKNSYNIGAGLYRMSRMAGYVKYNMPLGATYFQPQLSDEEAWDVAAFINSQQRPSKDLSKDWPNLAGKPADHPFGPFVDGFSEQQHKYGPFAEIDAKLKTLKKEQGGNTAGAAKK
jgi:thiosulfate dehydrogenase